MQYRKLILSISVGTLMSCGSLFAADELTKGESVFKELISKLAGANTIGTNLNFDAQGKSQGKVRNISGTVKLAFDMTDVKNDSKKIEVNTTIEGNAIKVILNTIGEDAYFVANLPGHPPMSYHFDSSGATKAGKAPQGYGTAEDLTGYGTPGKGGANPLSSVMGRVGKGMTADERNKMADEALVEAKKKSNITYIAPNCLKFLPRDGSKITTKLYFDPATKLIQTVLVNDPQKGSSAKAVFSDWIINSAVDTKLAQARNFYKEFDQQAMGKLIGAGMGLMAGNQSGKSSSFNMPAFNSGSAPAAAQSKGGFTFPTFGGVVDGGNTNSSGDFTSGDGDESMSEMSSSIEGAMGKATAGMENAGMQLQNLMKQFNSAEFKNMMEQTKKKVEEAQKQLNSPEVQAQIKDAQKAAKDAQSHLNSPEFKEQMRKAQEAALEMQKTFEKQMKDAGY
jgi:hypothetical protein